MKMRENMDYLMTEQQWRLEYEESQAQANQTDEGHATL